VKRLGLLDFIDEKAAATVVIPAAACTKDKQGG
jgi:hypothetical protein